MNPNTQNAQDGSSLKDSTPSKIEETRKNEIDSFDTQDIPAYLISREKLLSFLKSEFPGKYHCYVRFVFLDPRGSMNADTVIDDA